MPARKVFTQAAVQHTGADLNQQVCTFWRPAHLLRLGHPLINDLVDGRLDVAGDEYTIADMAVWPWYGTLVMGKLYEAGEFLQVQNYTHLLRWANQIGHRPAVQRGRMVNRTFGDPAQQLHERHDASYFNTNTQDRLCEQSVPRFLAASLYVTAEYRNQENTHQHLTACGVPVSNLRAIRVNGERGGRQNLFRFWRKCFPHGNQRGASAMS